MASLLILIRFLKNIPQVRMSSSSKTYLKALFTNTVHITDVHNITE